MPVLKQRQDGRYIVIRNRDGYYQTWQIGEKGVSYLRDRRVRDQEPFEEDLFQQLKRAGLVYIYDTQGLDRHRDEMITRDALGLGERPQRRTPACPVCSGGPMELLYEDREIRLYSCGNCYSSLSVYQQGFAYL